MKFGICPITKKSLKDSFLIPITSCCCLMLKSYCKLAIRLHIDWTFDYQCQSFPFCIRKVFFENAGQKWQNFKIDAFIEKPIELNRTCWIPKELTTIFTTARQTYRSSRGEFDESSRCPDNVLSKIERKLYNYQTRINY